METDLTHIRRWLLEDFKSRATPLVPEILTANPGFEAFDLMEAVRLATGKAWLKAEEQAYVLDQYIVHRWTPRVEEVVPLAPGPVRNRRRPVKPLTGSRGRGSLSLPHGKAR